MAYCDHCGTRVLFGGKRDRGHRFCSARCHEKGRPLLDAFERVGPLVPAALKERHQGRCPACAGAGPVDVHSAHYVYSLVLYTSWTDTERVSCRPCGRRAQSSAVLKCLLLGWWGIPFGLLMTPIQIARNLHGLFSPPDPRHPSAALKRHVQTQVA